MDDANLGKRKRGPEADDEGSKEGEKQGGVLSSSSGIRLRLTRKGDEFQISQPSVAEVAPAAAADGDEKRRAGGGKGGAEEEKKGVERDEVVHKNPLVVKKAAGEGGGQQDAAGGSAAVAAAVVVENISSGRSGGGGTVNGEVEKQEGKEGKGEGVGKEGGPAEQALGDRGGAVAAAAAGAVEGDKGQSATAAAVAGREAGAGQRAEGEDREGGQRVVSRIHRVPSHSAWFSWARIHPIERRSLPDFFNSSSAARTPSLYREYRDFIIAAYRRNPNRPLTFTEVRRCLVGDVTSIRKVFEFLDQWGLINYEAKQAEVAAAAAAAGGRGHSTGTAAAAAAWPSMMPALVEAETESLLSSSAAMRLVVPQDITPAQALFRFQQPRAPVLPSKQQQQQARGVLAGSELLDAVGAVKKKSVYSAAAGGGGAAPAGRSVTAPAGTAAAAAEMEAANAAAADAVARVLAAPAVAFHCNSCDADCSRLRYHYQKQADYDVCSLCFSNGRFGRGMAAGDFIRMETTAEASAAGGDEWNEQETLLLLEALELFGDKWSEIAEHVGTKNASQCILRFIQLPIEDPFLSDILNEKSVTTVEAPLPKAEGKQAAAAAAAADGADANAPVSAEGRGKGDAAAETVAEAAAGDGSAGVSLPAVSQSELTSVDVKDGREEKEEEKDGGAVEGRTEDNGKEDEGQTKAGKGQQGAKETAEEAIMKASRRAEKLEAVAGGSQVDEAVEEKSDDKLPQVIPFADAANPVMAQIAFLAAMVGPRVAAAAAQAALNSLIEEEPASERDVEELRGRGGRAAAALEGAGGRGEKQRASNGIKQEGVSVFTQQTTSRADAGEDTGGREGEEGEDAMDIDKAAAGADGVEGEGAKSGRQGAENGGEDSRAAVDGPLPAVAVRAAAATALAAAAVKARLLAEEEEKRIQEVMSSMLEKQIKKVELKMKKLEEIEELMMKERGQAEVQRQNLLSERVRMAGAKEASKLQEGSEVGKGQATSTGVTSAGAATAAAGGGGGASVSGSGQGVNDPAVSKKPALPTPK